MLSEACYVVGELFSCEEKTPTVFACFYTSFHAKHNTKVFFQFPRLGAPFYKHFYEKLFFYC